MSESAVGDFGTGANRFQSGPGQWVPWCDEHDALGLPCGGSFVPNEDACRFNPCKRCFPDDEGGTT